MNARSILFPIALAIAAMVSIQAGAAIAKRLFPIIGADGATAIRLILAAVLLLAIWRPWRLPLSRRQAGIIVVYGATLGLMNLLFYLALDTIPLGLAVALEFTGPLLLAMTASRKPVDFLWIVLAGAGVFVLLPIGPTGSGLDPVGVALAVGAGACWALYIVFGKMAGAADQGRTLSLGMVCAAIVGAPMGVAHAGADLLAPSVLGLGLLVALLSSAIPYSLELAAMSRLPTRSFGVLMSVEPAVAALSGFLLLGERLTAMQWAAIASVIAASAGSAATSKSSHGPEIPPN